MPVHMHPGSAVRHFRALSLAGLLVLLVTAVFSSGYNNFDEHFQVLEFANYKMGYSPPGELAWEFHQQIRPALQPFIAWCVAASLRHLACYNPFTVALILRLLSALLTWIVLYRVTLRLLPEFKTTRGKQLFVWTNFFTWFVAYIGVRFGAENISGALFFLALSFFPGIDISNKNKTLKLLFSGLLLGFALFLRVQMGLAFIGMAIWMLFVQKWHWKTWIPLIAGGIIAIAVSVVVDYWFYGNWLFTPARYIDVNLLQNKASEFGTHPVWQYFIFFFESAVPPLSIVMLVLFIIGISKKPLHLFSLVLITFVLGHSFIGHKEMRFLFPVIYAFLFLTAIGAESFIDRYRHYKIYRVVFILAVITNFGTLAYRMFTPAENRIKYYRFMYSYAKNHEHVVLVAYDASPYNVVTLETNFYKPQNLRVYSINSRRAFDHIKFITPPGRKFVFLSPTLKPPSDFAAYKMKRIYTPLPEWILNVNFNDWQERSSMWTLYELEQ